MSKDGSKIYWSSLNVAFGLGHVKPASTSSMEEELVVAWVIIFRKAPDVEHRNGPLAEAY